jgi:hypothetical protein
MEILTERNEKGRYRFTLKNQGTKKHAWLMYWEAGRKVPLIGVGDTLSDCITEALDVIEAEISEHLKEPTDEPAN